ncbi:FtsX-like permease family protein [bacterium]|nr:FtsX-like permease family protein [bacterium]
MSIGRLVIKEILHRRINFFSGLVSVVLSIAVLIGVLFTLAMLDQQTARVLAEKEKETAARMEALQDDYRKIMKLLGFNLLIIPQNQKLADYFEEEQVTEYMPAFYADRLANAKLVTIQHILPSLQQKIYWPEKNRTIILIGTRGEIAAADARIREPLLVAVPWDHAVVGYELSQSLRLKPQDQITLLGHTFTVQSCNEERGSKDDISIWIDLKQAQQLLNKPEQINAILALKCHCHGNDIDQVRRDIAEILPGVQVIEQAGKVVTRAEARDRAKEEAAASMAAEIANRKKLRSELERFSSLLTPLVFVVSAVWLTSLFFINVRDRRSEVGLLRACGASDRKVMSLFLIKALMMGIIGALFGYLLGALIAVMRNPDGRLIDVINIPFFILAMLTAMTLSLIASWIPALCAARQDPALILREE